MKYATATLATLKKFLFCSCLVVLIAIDFPIARAEVSNSHTEESITSGWLGFTPGFNPNWSGETKQINWRRPGGTHGLTIWNYSCLHCVDFNSIELNPPKPIELLSSSRSIETNSVAQISVPGKYVAAEKGDDQSSTSPGIWNATNAHYAEVIDLDDLLLGRGLSLSSFESDVNDNSYTMTARQLAIIEIDPIINDSSQVTAFADMDFSAAYQVNKPASFELSGTFSGSTEMDVSFTLTDRESGEIYYEQTISWFEPSGENINFSFNGDFSPGIYDLNFSSTASSGIFPGGTIDPSGIGEFSIDFEVFSIPSGDFDGNGAVGSADLSTWIASFGQHANDGDINGDGITTFGDASAWLELNGAHDVNGDGSVDFFDFTAWVQQVTPGDADGDNDNDGNDFLIWQRTLSPPVVETDSEFAKWEASYGNLNSSGDFDNDGDADGNDFLGWQQNRSSLESSTSPLQQIPEPHAAILFVLGSALFFSRSRFMLE